MSLTSQVSNKLISPSSSNKKTLTKTPKEKRKPKLDREPVTPPVSTQWYTNENLNGNVSTTPVFELRQEVIKVLNLKFCFYNIIRFCM